MKQPLYMVQLPVDARKLYAHFACRHRAGNSLDEGYAVHALFASLFDHGASVDNRVAPKPFHIVSSERGEIQVLGYCRLDADGLRERAQHVGQPDAWQVCDMQRIASKPMPQVFEEGKQLGFCVRVCPIRRVHEKGPKKVQKAEVDAFLLEAWEKPGQVVSREQVYQSWLAEQLDVLVAAKLVQSQMQRYRLVRLYRRSHGEGQKGIGPRAPDVTLSGVLQVKDSEAFAEGLARGIGRHRAFGFGMLLLRAV